MKALNKLLKNKRTLIFIDFEGTQFTHEIIAWGAIKVNIDENGNIIDTYPGFHVYINTDSKIGSVVTKMTGIDKVVLEKHGVDFIEAIAKFVEYVGEELQNVLLLTFGSNDLRMFHDTMLKFNLQENGTARQICKAMVDFMAFIGQYIRDSQGNNYSLTNYLKIFKIEPCGKSHDPLNDSIDLLNLYKAFINSPEIVANEYLKLISNLKIFPDPIKKTVTKLCNGENVTSEEFKNYVKTFLS